MNEFWLLLLPVAAASGWYLNTQKNKEKPSTDNFSRDYLIGLNYLLNEQPDKAVDVFIKMLAVDTETVETHLALGSLFRKRGEVDRAIRIHQNLIARPQLPKLLQTQALLALGQDYLHAGVFDRAEKIFNELIFLNEQIPQALQHLLSLYEQQHEWSQAISTAKQIQNYSKVSMHSIIAQYYCELAQQAFTNKDMSQAKRYLKQALSSDKKCVRANLIRGAFEMEQQDFRTAIACYEQVLEQNPDYFSEILEPLVQCYETLNQQEELIQYLQKSFELHPQIETAIVLAKQLKKQNNAQQAKSFIVSYLQKQPALKGLALLLEWEFIDCNQSIEKFDEYLSLMNRLIEEKFLYQCTQCGFSSKILHWLCLSCNHWNTTKPLHVLKQHQKRVIHDD